MISVCVIHNTVSECVESAAIEDDDVHDGKDSPMTLSSTTRSKVMHHVPFYCIAYHNAYHYLLQKVGRKTKLKRLMMKNSRSISKRISM